MSKLLDADELLVEARHYARLMSLAHAGLSEERDHSALERGVMHLDQHLQDALDLVHDMLADELKLKNRRDVVGPTAPTESKG
ncbi:MAG: hypothetical protein ABJO09_11590 [Hyphomicrobiales bacterium]